MPISFPSMKKVFLDIQKFSDIQKFKTSKDLFFQKQQKHTKKAGSKDNFNYKKAVSFTRYSL